MNNINIPKILILNNRKLNIKYIEKVKNLNNRNVIFIYGERTIFLTLANVILFMLNELIETIPFSKFQFIESLDETDLIIKIDDTSNLPNGKIITKENKIFEWLISDRNLTLLASGFHSLGYANNHLHIDEEIDIDDISIYCEVTPE